MTEYKVTLTKDDLGNVHFRAEPRPTLTDAQVLASNFVALTAANADEGWDVAVDVILRDAALIQGVT